MTIQQPRIMMVTIGNFLYDHASLLDYTEGSERMMGEKYTWIEIQTMLEKGERLTGDCSAFYTEICMWAGCHDPNGLNFNGYGYTGTLLNNMPHITLADAQIGDAIVFGAYPGLHVVYIIETNPTNPTVYSHGAPGFDKTTLDAMWSEVFADDPITVLSLAPFIPPSPKPTPPADPYHYAWFDTTVIDLPHSRNSERAVVENYDQRRGNPSKYHAQLIEIEENLNALAVRVKKNMASDPKHNNKYHRAWRLAQLTERAAGTQVVK